MLAKQHHIKVNASNIFAPELIASESGLSISEAKQAMQKGAVWLTDNTGTRRIRRASKKLASASTLHFYHSPAVLSQEAEPPLLHTDEIKYSIWIKPRGVFSQGSKWGDHCSITRLVESNDSKQRPAFLIHRLDKAAMGLILIGHSKRATGSLTEMFAKRTIRKTYQAVVAGNFEQIGWINLNTDIDGRNAITYVRSIDYDRNSDRSLLQVNIDTGRKHQIRRHLSEAGFPIIGDRLYGGGNQNDLQLAAVSLAFRCPLNHVEREYQLPDHFRPIL
ncbi:MAG: RNA pseudouridine synthase [Gammaproteobacteria bacterium]|nr:RNA pseudouridine synthase [Gammaproteobacteria bacterium]